MTTLSVSHSAIRKKILSLDVAKGTGPDGISNSLLKKCVEGFVTPLHLLFSSSLHEGAFPKMWKISHIVPIHKKGSKLSVENYRGIAILSAIPKIFDSLVYDCLYPWIEARISDSQQGFLKKRSTVTNLAEFVSRTTQWMKDGLQVDTIYTDMSKAFDVVNIKALLSVLKKNGIGGACLDWIRTYLENRVQYVKLNASRSRTIKVDSGVPQGSHLGPLLFITVMNELPGLISEVFLLIYADDVKLFFPIRCVKDCLILQDNLLHLINFCHMFGLRVNAGKCNVVSYTRKLNKLLFEYKIGEEPIPRATSVRDLGVEMDSELSFTKHIEKVIAKANSMFGMIKRLSQELDDPYTIIAIYTGLVRSSIEYASVIWQPCYEIHKKRLERVQKKFVRYALRNLGWREELPEYRSLCMLVGIDSLENRRILADALFLKDIVSERYYSPYLCRQVTRYNGRTGLRRVRAFHLANRRQNYARNEPVYRMMTVFNNLQEEINVDMPRDKIKFNLKQYFISR